MLTANQISPWARSIPVRLHMRSEVKRLICSDGTINSHASLNLFAPTCPRRYLGMPKAIQDRVSDYFDYLLTRNHPGSDGMLAVSQLPSSMFRDISSRMYEGHVKKVRRCA